MLAGIGPSSSFCLRSINSRFLSLPISVGMNPENRFPERSISCRLEQFVSSLGILPDIWLSLKYAKTSCFSFPISTGIGPVIMLSKRYKPLNLLKFPISGGIFPVKLLLLSIRSVNLSSLSMSAGRVPPILFPERSNCSSDKQFNISTGNSPDKLFPPRKSWVRFEFSMQRFSGSPPAKKLSDKNKISRFVRLELERLMGPESSSNSSSTNGPTRLGLAQKDCCCPNSISALLRTPNGSVSFDFMVKSQKESEEELLLPSPRLGSNEDPSIVKKRMKWAK
ncbi:receptor-like protein kinase-related family protein [Striga asiatica]|uniref:Receptor-like protein kinase-related family protein n=1 Tax=Striga asiatica TaxID=4170 RepID=A0A5A7Q0U3_STRAF|nr:receptor-like protein kinase-related family protein [Striga asiatica]